MRGLLVRVGIDSTDGNWNAPVRKASGEFAYVTITETKRIRLPTRRNKHPVDTDGDDTIATRKTERYATLATRKSFGKD